MGRSSNNHGNFARASILALACGGNELTMIHDPDDATDGTDTDDGGWERFRGYCGSLSVYADFNWPSYSGEPYGSEQWQYAGATTSLDPPNFTFDTSTFKPIGPVNSAFQFDLQGPYSGEADGCLGEEMRRTNGGAGVGWWYWPPNSGDGNIHYVYEGLQGLFAEALILERCGYSPWTVQSNALERAVDWMFTWTTYLPTNDDAWVIAVAGFKYNRTDWENTSGFSYTYQPGKSVAGAEWMTGN